MSILQLQQRVLSPDAAIDYSTVIMQSYPSYAIQREPFVGFKILCRDTQVNGNYNMQYGNCEQRMNQIDSFLQQSRILMGTGVILRATHFQMPDGIWVITMPVPRSQVTTSLNNLFNVLRVLEQQLGIILTGDQYEVCVSGRCPLNETETILGSLCLPENYRRILQPPSNTPYKDGHLIRINDVYACFRTRYSPGIVPVQTLYEMLMTVSSLIAAIYR